MSKILGDQRTWSIKERWNGNAPDCLFVSAFDGFDAYIGTLPLTERKNHRIGLQPNSSKFDYIIKDLRRIPDQHIYPVFREEFTRVGTAEIEMWDCNYYLKAPNISSYTEDDAIAKSVLEEVEINEKLMKYPHPNLAVYLGCIVHNGLIVRLAFRKYFQTLSERTLNTKSAADFTAQDRTICMDNIEAAAAYLHQQGLAHNDISPHNIMFDTNDMPVLIDLDACAPIGSKLKKGGSVAGWRGPLADNGKMFKMASVECDELAIKYLRRWLTDELVVAHGSTE